VISHRTSSEIPSMQQLRPVNFCSILCSVALNVGCCSFRFGGGYYSCNIRHLNYLVVYCSTCCLINVTHHIQLGIKLHLVCLELCTPYSFHPKLHFDTNLIFVSLLVPEISAHFFCPSGNFFLEKMKDLCQDFHYFTIT
jgi:hypothetical protein